MTATSKIVRIGKSRGIQIPPEMIRQCGVGDEVIVEAGEGGLFVRPNRSGKMSMEDSFKAMAKDRKAITEATQWAENGLADGLNEA